MGSRDSYSPARRKDRAHSLSRSHSPAPRSTGRRSRRHSPFSESSRNRSPSSSRKKRRRRSRSPESRTKKRRRDRSLSSSSDSSNETSSSEDDRKSRKKKSRSKHKDRKKEKRSKKDKKKSKRKEKKKSSGAVTEYGAYGIITSADMYNKEAEFRAWLVEVKSISPEILDNQKMKSYFAEYMEDYNTATLPVKFYDLDKWERQQYVRQRAEAGAEDYGEFNILNDEERLRQHSKALRANKLPEINFSRDQLAELKKVSEERVAADRLRKMGYQPKESLGVRYERDDE